MVVIMMNASFITKNKVFFFNDLLFIINQKAHCALFHEEDTIILRYERNMNYVFNIILCDENEMVLEGNINDVESQREYRVNIKLMKKLNPSVDIHIYDDNTKVIIDGVLQSQLLDSYHITENTMNIVDIKRHDIISIQEVLDKLKRKIVYK